jgi:hypothetical protein
MPFAFEVFTSKEKPNDGSVLKVDHIDQTESRRMIGGTGYFTVSLVGGPVFRMASSSG